MDAIVTPHGLKILDNIKKTEFIWGRDKKKVRFVSGHIEMLRMKFEAKYLKALKG